MDTPVSVLTPIPNMTSLRAGKDGYADRIPVDSSNQLHNDELVDPRSVDWFHDASSYYSKPNSMTGEVLPIPDAPLVRQDLLRRLVAVEEFLRFDPSVERALGTPAHLRIDDALRPLEVQEFAFYTAWPQVIKKQHPEMTDEQVAEQVPNYCARPGGNKKPTPHLTGGAVDVCLVNLLTGEPFDRGHVPGKVKGTAFPDFHEGYHLTVGASDIENSPEQQPVAQEGSEICIGRRVLYNAMTVVGGLQVNPNEIWHYGVGDPLSAYVAGEASAYYGVAQPPQWYLDQLESMKRS